MNLRTSLGGESTVPGVLKRALSEKLKLERKIISREGKVFSSNGLRILRSGTLSR